MAIPRSNDWALVEIDESSCFLPNEVKLPTQNVPMVIGDMVAEDFQGEGQVQVILASSRVRTGWLMSSPMSFKVENSFMDTRLIILDSKLGEFSCLVPEDYYCANGMSFHSLR